jgi:NTE family protein
LAKAEGANEHVILMASRDVDDEWYRFCLRSADRTIVVIDARKDAPARGDHTELAGVAAAFVDGTASATPGRVARWIDLLGATTWFQLGPRDRVEHGSARMARRLTGRAIGVVLSGGGARGFAHIGALQGLLEHGVTIDRVGGCSMGALVAALHAAGGSPTAMVDALRSGFTRRSTLRQISLSRQSLLRGDRLDHLLGELLGDRTFEELPPSAFVVSADLLTAELIQHRRGRVATAVRASMAIPGLLPPVQQDTRLLVDGGLVDGLPVAMMATSGEGPVIAVDVMRDHPRSRSNRGRGVLEILSLAALIGRRPAKTKGRDLAAAMIVPDVTDIGLLDFHCIDEAAEAGRNAVARAAKSGALDAALVAAGADPVE